MLRRILLTSTAFALLGLGSARAAESAQPAPATPPAEIVVPATPPRAPRPAWMNRLIAKDVVIAALHPNGLETCSSVGWRKNLYKSESALFRDNYLYVAVAPKTNPSYSRIGPVLEVQPLSIFRLHASAEYVRYYATFGNLQSFASPSADHSEAARAARNGEAYATNVFHAVVEPMVQAKLGPIAVRNQLSLEYFHANVKNGDTVFFASALDTLAPADGWVASNALDVLFVSERIVAGLRYTAVRPLYGASDYAPGESTRNPIARFALDGALPRAPNGYDQLAVLAFYSFRESRTSRLRKPAVFTKVGWMTDHRYRQGERLPSVVAGVAFEYDLSSR